MTKQRKKHPKLRIAILCILAALIVAVLVFMHFGGFSTGKSADPEEFAKYAQGVEDISIPENVTVVALGEATHGNVEFQQLKLTVFRQLVERYGVRALALEGDAGGCEQVNRYIHGGEGTSQDAAASIGFAIYRTQEMADLIEYMRKYNDAAAPGDDLRFYGFDMQRCTYNVQFLAEECKTLGVENADLEKLVTEDGWSEAYDTAERKDIITQVKTQLEGLEQNEITVKAIHFANILLQNCQLQTDGSDTTGDYAMLRDQFMTENTLWIAEQERALGFEQIFVTAHQGHVARWGSYDQMGKLLADELGDKYYVIGTDFYKTSCNMPSGSDGKRTNQTFYSHDPLAKAAKQAGQAICWLDFSRIPEDSSLTSYISDYIYMGSLGEGYSMIMRLMPPSYRIFQPPATLYDGMIYVADATPTKIIEKEGL